MRRHAISSATGLATKPHLYRLKGLDLLSPSMQVLIGIVECSAIDNRKQEGVAIVDDFKASIEGKVTFHQSKSCICCYHVGCGTESTWKALEKLAHDYLVEVSTESTARKELVNMW